MVKKWQYLIISSHPHDLNAAGKEGWEFVSFVENDSLPRTALMKRELAENKKKPKSK